METHTKNVAIPDTYNFLCGSPCNSVRRNHNVSRRRRSNAAAKETIMHTTYKIQHQHGLTEYGFATYEDACDAVRAVYTDPAIGHDGDISEGGEITLCWSEEEDIDNQAVCKIIVSHD